MIFFRKKKNEENTNRDSNKKPYNSDYKRSSSRPHSREENSSDNKRETPYNRENRSESSDRSSSNKRDSRPFSQRENNNRPKLNKSGDRNRSNKNEDQKAPYLGKDNRTFKEREEDRNKDRKTFNGRDDRPFDKRDNTRKPFKRRDDDRDSSEGRTERKPFERRENKPFDKRDNTRKPFKRRDDDRDSSEGRTERKPFERRESRPFDNRDNTRKPFKRRDDDRDSSEGRTERKPFERRESRPFDKRDNTRKPFNRRDDDRDSSEERGDRKPYARRDERTPDKRVDSQITSPYSKKKQLEHKKKNIAFEDGVRLNRYIANAGICSRREADGHIAKGLVQINNVVVKELGTIVNIGDSVKFNGKIITPEKKVYVLLNKPKDFVTTVDDPHAKRTVLDLVASACTERIYPVGRLDRMTTGVLLLTNDGDLTKQLTHPAHNKKKIYHVYLDKPFIKEDMIKLAEGVELEDGKAFADKISYVGLESKSEVGVEIHSGKNRVIRRMFAHLGYEVEKLDRVYYGGLTKKGITRGKWRFLSEKEIGILKMGSYK